MPAFIWFVFLFSSSFMHIYLKIHLNRHLKLRLRAVKWTSRKRVKGIFKIPENGIDIWHFSDLLCYKLIFTYIFYGLILTQKEDRFIFNSLLIARPFVMVIKSTLQRVNKTIKTLIKRSEYINATHVSPTSFVLTWIVDMLECFLLNNCS